MKHVWNVFVFWGYIFGIDKLLLIKADEKKLDISTGESGFISCEDNAGEIRINNATFITHESYCARNTSNDCVLSDADFNSFETRCNNNSKCTVDYPKNTSCLKEDRYFSLSYSCLGRSNLLCTFEISFCDWRNTGTDLQWKRYSPAYSSRINGLLNVDHTTKSQYGFFIFLRKEMNNVKGQLKSRMISFDKNKCLVLRYKMDSQGTLTIKRTSSRSTIFHQKGNHADTFWSVASISLYKGNSSEIIIEGMVSGNSYIAIDDIDIQNWDCNDSLPLSCNFEENWCGFERNPGHRENEEWVRSLAGSDMYGRPYVDHTIGHGHYVYTTTKKQPIYPRRAIIITLEEELEIRCLSLWYYKYGDTLGHLNIYTVVNQTEKILYSMIDRRTQVWSQFQANVYKVKKIILEYNFTENSFGGIALDDIYISPISCEDEQPVVHACREKNDEIHIQCPVIDVVKEEFAFESNNAMSCTTTSEQIENSLQQKFQTCNKTCEFTPAGLVNDDNCWYMSKKLQLTYSCINGKENNTHKDDTTKAPTLSTLAKTQRTYPISETTTSVAILTQTVSSTPLRDVTTDSLKSDLPSSTPVTGIVVGVVLSLVTLSVILVIAFIYFRRTRYAEKKGHSIVANEDSHSDYTGHQNTAFLTEVNVTTQTDYCEIRTSKHNDQYHDISDTFSPSINTTNDDEYSEIANVVNSPNNNQNASTNYQHQYISLDPNATGFDRSNQQTKLHNESKNKHNLNETTSFKGGDDYAILDPDDLNESKNNTPKVLPMSENYVVLDPTETGFNRQENTDTVCNYELATPINLTETSEDPYDVSKDETYDTSCNSRHKEKENNIYSHTVDNVYDTAGNQRKKEEGDATYDHFYGQQSEDDYDISKPL